MTQVDTYREPVNPYARALAEARAALAAKEAADRVVVDRWERALQDVRDLIGPTLAVVIRRDQAGHGEAWLDAPLSRERRHLATEYRTDDLERHLASWAFAQAVRDLEAAELAAYRVKHGPCSYEDPTPMPDLADMREAIADELREAVAGVRSAIAAARPAPQAWIVPHRLVEPSTPVPWSVVWVNVGVSLVFAFAAGVGFGSAFVSLAVFTAVNVGATGGVVATRQHIKQHSTRHEPQRNDRT